MSDNNFAKIKLLGMKWRYQNSFSESDIAYVKLKDNKTFEHKFNGTITTWNYVDNEHDSVYMDYGIEILEKLEKIPDSSALDIQVGGSHYKNLAIQPVEFIHKNNLDYFQGNAIKYLVRHKDKNGIEDLKKAKHYIDMLIEFEYGKKE